MPPQNERNKMSEFIRHGRGKLLGQIIENGNVTYIRDAKGVCKN